MGAKMADIGTKTGMSKVARSVGLFTGMLLAGMAAAHADGMDAPKGKGKAEAAAPAAPDYTLTFNVGASSNYVFRGFSQSDQGAAVQGGIDFAYKWLYVGVWSSSIDFGQTCTGTNAVGPPGPVFPPNRSCASAEVDIYAGLKFPVSKTWNVDVGVITYNYPHSLDTNLTNAKNTATTGTAKWDYVEGKVGVSGNITTPWTAGLTAFYSPEYTGGTGKVWTIEGTTAYTLPKWGQVEPSLSATLGYQAGNSSTQYLASIGKPEMALSAETLVRGFMNTTGHRPSDIEPGRFMDCLGRWGAVATKAG